MTISTDRDRVRLLIGDTDIDDPLLYDDEIEVCVNGRQVYDATTEAMVTNIPAAAADAAAAIAARFARKFDFAEDGQRFDVSKQHAHYLALERTLRSRAGGVPMPLTEDDS